MNYYTYEQNLDMVTTAAFEIITNNGYNMDYDEREHYIKAIRDKAANCYYEDITNNEWLSSILESMGY